MTGGRHEDSGLGPNAHLIGATDARSRLSTPALVLDLDLFDSNVASMAAFAREAGVALRPHAKTHKCVEIARQQIAAGATGVCCATLGEAEVMAAGGVRDILITSPLVTPEKIARLVALAAKVDHLAVVVDHPRNVQDLAVAAQAQRQVLGVLVDLDAGMRRIGAAGLPDCVKLARQCADSPSLAFEGLQFYTAFAQHIEGFADRKANVSRYLDKLRRACQELHRLRCPAAVVTGGGTGTFELEGRSGVVNELQPGSYVFLDSQYRALDVGEGGVQFEESLFVQAAVVSVNHPGHITVDAGLKQFALDGGRPSVVRGADPGASFDYMGDEHGRVTLPRGAVRPDLGARIEFRIPHCDPTINLYNQIHAFRGEALIDIWRVDARGS